MTGRDSVTLCPRATDGPPGSGGPEGGGRARAAVPAARLRGLRKEFRGTVALDSVDLDVPAGSVLGLLGPNGSGKTTLLRLLLGLSRPTSGRVELLGQPMPDGAATALPHVGALVEGTGFLPSLSGRDNLTRCAAAEPLLASPAAPAVDAALHRVGLAGGPDEPAARRYRAYSPGMRQRLGLAAALLVPRRLVVLDEPTTALDPVGAREVRGLIHELRAAGTTVLLSSHLLAEVEEVCTHVAVLMSGAVVAAGELETLLNADSPTLVVRTTEPGPALAALRAAGVSGSYPERGSVVVDLTDTAADLVLRVLVQAGVPVSEARRRRTGLEDLFVQLAEAAG
ncbi:MAG TPA: ABC transporter ATP-binding protein [Pseudonocardia sp.]|jgi:ABC-2 type transport system ATP-binding protein